MVVTFFVALLTLALTVLVTSLFITPATSFVFEDNVNVDSLDQSLYKLSHIVRDSETILLSGQKISSGDYIHLYDSSPYLIVNGHIATKIPCNDSFQPLLNILVGQAPRLQVIQLHLVEELSTAGKLCIYHADLEPDSSVAHSPAGTTVGNITDIAIQNPTGNSLELPPTSSLVIGVNEIKDGAIEIEH